MLSQNQADFAWDSLQDPRCYSNHSAGYMLLLAALDLGWSIVQASGNPAREPSKMDEVRFTLVHPENGMTRRIWLLRSCELTQLLSKEQAGSYPPLL